MLVGFGDVAMTYEDLKWMAEEVAKRMFEGEYRGYRFMGLRWSQPVRKEGQRFVVYAYMLNSPLSPCDGMWKSSLAFEDDPMKWKKYTFDYMALAVEQAIDGLKELIDKAYDNPAEFQATVMSVVEADKRLTGEMEEEV